MSPSDRFVEALEAYTQLCRTGARPDRAAFLAQHADIAAQLAECLDSVEFVEQIAPQLRDASADASPVTAFYESPRELGDFRILREIGRGGMGVVYEAEQISLERRVALKVLPFAGTFGELQLKRFKNEARAAALLDHPNIVSVYSVGTDRGVHYYAMRLIEGASLADAIRGLRQGSSRLASTGSAGLSSTTAPSAISLQAAAIETKVIAALTTICQSNPLDYFRRVAQMGVQAAIGLQHAHEQGVLHRDIKPANLLLDAQGRIYISDFGLARISADPGMTITGDVIGTLRYMSPEQLAGKELAIDQRADIYSLGATLYELATFVPAFDGEDRQDIVKRITGEEPRAPRHVNGQIPVDLDTIIRKAMRKDPAGRYASADDLAADLQRFVEAKAIVARPPALHEVVQRWSRRHRALILTAVGVAALMLSVTTLLVWQQRSEAIRQRDVARQERRRADEQRQRAEAEREFARGVVDEMYSKVAQNWLSGEAQMTQVQRSFLEKACAFYERLADEQSDDPQIVRNAAGAQFRLSFLRRALGEADAALAGAQAAVDGLSRIVKGQPDSLDDRRRLAQAQVQLGAVLIDLKKYDQAEKALREAEQNYRTVLAKSPSDNECRSGLADALHDRAVILAEHGSPAEAMRLLNESLATDEALAQVTNSPLDHQLRAAKSLIHLGQIACDTGNLGDGEAALQRVVTLLEPSLNDPRQGDEVRLVFSGALYSLTTKILNPANRRDEARAACVRAADLLRQSVERFPAVPIYRQRLAECLAQVSALSNALGDPAETEAALFEAIELWRSLVDEAPANAVYRERLAKLLHIRAQAIPIEADDQAEPLFREAMALRQTLVAESPDSPQRGSELAATMNNLARILMRKGELVEARDLLHQAIELQQAAVAAQPGNVIFQRFLENHRHSLAEVEEQLKPETSLPEAAHDGHAEKDEIDAN